MCLSIPGEVLDLQAARALVRTRGRAVWCNALVQPEVRPGDHVLTHAGLIIAIIPQAEALHFKEEIVALQELSSFP